MNIKELIEEIKELASITDNWDDTDELDEVEDFELVQDDDWIQEGKYQYLTQVYFYPAKNVYFMANRSRSGSYFSDYYYAPTVISIVEKHEKVVTKTIVEWVAVKEGETAPSLAPAANDSEFNNV